MARFDIITFDCYGTLIDWETGISEAFIREAKKDGVALEREAVLEAHAAIEPEVQSALYMPYRDVLREVAMRVGERLGWEVNGRRAAFLPESVPDWLPFPDTVPALRELERLRLRLGILSNIDDDLLAATRRHFAVRFDVLVTAEQVMSYKPAQGHFTKARERIGPGRWLHVAQSYFHDVQPAAALGIPVVWVNRKGEAPTADARPTLEVSNLTELVDWLRSMA